uniref:7TM_GPCR_Srx domain-containing protein n=1 Tax=Heterorhabditis bacteriophora TaxID=37862 RepID=A0A1I7WT71_HETBA
MNASCLSHQFLKFILKYNKSTLAIILAHIFVATVRSFIFHNDTIFLRVRSLFPVFFCFIFYDHLGTYLSPAVHFPKTVRAPHSPYSRTAQKVLKISDNPGTSKLFTYLSLFTLIAFVLDYCLEKQ